MVSNQNSRTKYFEKVLENNLENKLSAMELTKKSLFICKKCAKVLCQGFEKRKQDFREDGGQKITLSNQGFDWRYKMSIYKLKLGFCKLFNGLWTFPRVQGLAHIK